MTKKTTRTMADVSKDIRNLSTGLNCRFYLATDGKWYYMLEQYRHRDQYDDYGPFSSEAQAEQHLNKNHANPGGWMRDPSGKTKPPSSPSK